MTALLNLLRFPFLAPLAGVVAFISLIWIVGPLLAISGYNPLSSERNRLIAAGIIIVLFVLYQLIKYLLGKRKNRKLSAELAEPDKDSAAVQTEEEIATLNKVFDQALQELKKVKLTKGKGQALYALPWYLIIGPPGSGKTTALINSGLNFPLAKRLGTHKIKGVGGTRNCDWWFTDHAVILDTAGRYTTQDSHEAVDSSAWMSFLSLLKKYRRRRPINGVMVAVSLSDLLQQSESERSAHALAIRKRIQELHEQLGIHFPVYVLFTKSDLIAGCMEFFDDLSKEERTQIWGMTFPLDKLDPDSEGVVETFSNEFRLLEERLNTRLVKRLQDERDSQRRDLIYQFPQQFSALRELAQHFLDEVFRPSRFEQRSLLRGAYFTSGTQEGNPIDRLLGALAATFGVARQVLPSFSGSGRSYFLNRLFLSVMFQEAGIAGTNMQMERRRRLVHGAAYIGVLVLALLWVVAWYNSYSYNRDYVDQVEQQLVELKQTAATITPEQSEPVTVLALLDQARAIPGAGGSNAGAPWLLRLGLYQGDKLGSSAHTSYRNLLDRAFLSRLLLYLEGRIKTLLQQADSDNELYDALQAYMMLDRSVKERPFQAELIQNWFAHEWQNDLTLSDTQRQNLQQHLVTLLEQLPDSLPLYPDEDLIKKARTRLPKQLASEQIYQRLQRTDFGIAPFRLSDVAGSDTAVVFTRLSGAPLTAGVPGIYTQPGQIVFIDRSRQLLESLANGDWVLDIPPLPEGERQQQLVEVQERYWTDYCPQWQALLTDLALSPPRGSLQDAVDKLYILSGPNSPLRALLQAVADQTAQIPRCLEELTGVVKGEAPTVLDQLLTELDEIAVLLSPLAKAKEEGRNIDREAANDVILRFEQLAKNKPTPLNRWLSSLSEPIPIFLFEGLRAYMNGVWRRDVVSFCQQALRNRYPLVSSSRKDVTLIDFGKFFGPGGVLDNFIHQGDHRFTAFVDMSKSRWQWRAFDNNPGIPEDKLAMLQFGTQITEAFFSAGGARPAVGFKLQLTGLDPAIERVNFDFANQAVSFDAGSAASVPLQWPVAKGDDRLRVEFFPAGGLVAPIALEERGPWALFRLLEQAVVRPLASDVFDLTLRAGRYGARFELRADSVFNPFRLELEDFRCLQTL